MSAKSLLNKSNRSNFQMDLEHKSKRNSSQLDGSTYFSEADDDDDIIDGYEDDFMSDISSDDSFKDFLKPKAKSVDSNLKNKSSSFSPKPVALQTAPRNKFLKGLEDDDLSFYPPKERIASAPQERFKYGSEKYDDFNPQVTFLKDETVSPTDGLAKTKSHAGPTILKDNAKPKKVGFQTEPTSLSPRNKYLNLQSLQASQLEYETPNDSRSKFNQSRESLKKYDPKPDYFHSDFDKSNEHLVRSLSKPYASEEQQKEKMQKLTQGYSSYQRSTETDLPMKSHKFHKTKESANVNESNLLYGSLHRKANELSPYDIKKVTEPSKDYERFQSPHSKSKNSFSKYSDYLIDQLQPYPDTTKQLDLFQQRKSPNLNSKSDLDSPKSSASEQSSKKRLSIDHLQLKSVENTAKTKESSYTDFLSSLPSLDASQPRTTTLETKKSNGKYQKKSLAAKREKKSSAIKREEKLSDQQLLHDETHKHSSGVGGDDLLALFEQVTVADKPEFPFAKDKPPSLDQKRQMAKHMKPSEALAHTIVNQKKFNSMKQMSSSQQLIENVIESVAVQNQTYAFANQYNTTDDIMQTEKKSKDTGTKKKLKKAKPPKNYEGIGSLRAFQQLQRFSKSFPDLDDPLSTDSMRSSAYMIWLANHETKTKAKKKRKLVEEEKENEKKQKEIEEKVFENISARKAWAQKKEEEMVEQEQKQRIYRRKQREERLRQEEEKWKSAKRAEVARRQSLIKARKSHQIELKLKQEDKMILEQKQNDKKEANKRAVNKWNEERGKQWELERKRKLREKRIKEKANIEFHSRKVVEAKQNFSEWQKKKNQQQYRQHGQISYHEDKPPWCPPNKNKSTTIQ